MKISQGPLPFQVMKSEFEVTRQYSRTPYYKVYCKILLLMSLSKYDLQDSKIRYYPSLIRAVVTKNVWSLLN